MVTVSLGNREGIETRLLQYVVDCIGFAVLDGFCRRDREFECHLGFSVRDSDKGFGLVELGIRAGSALFPNTSDNKVKKYLLKGREECS